MTEYTRTFIHAPTAIQARDPNFPECKSLRDLDRAAFVIGFTVGRLIYNRKCYVMLQYVGLWANYNAAGKCLPLTAVLKLLLCTSFYSSTCLFVSRIRCVLSTNWVQNTEQRDYRSNLFVSSLHSIHARECTYERHHHHYACPHVSFQKLPNKFPFINLISLFALNDFELINSIECEVLTVVANITFLWAWRRLLW